MRPPLEVTIRLVLVSEAFTLVRRFLHAATEEVGDRLRVLDLLCKRAVLFLSRHDPTDQNLSLPLKCRTSGSTDQGTAGRQHALTS
jgi:hypothetical protein